MKIITAEKNYTEIESTNGGSISITELENGDFQIALHKPWMTELNLNLKSSNIFVIVFDKEKIEKKKE